MPNKGQWWFVTKMGNSLLNIQANKVDPLGFEDRVQPPFGVLRILCQTYCGFAFDGNVKIIALVVTKKTGGCGYGPVLEK